MEIPKESLACVFCGRNLARSDALKRHWTTCKVRKSHRLNLPPVKAKTRGRKLRACDLCSHLKRAYTSTQPCAPCAAKNQFCTYRRSHSTGMIQEYQLDTWAATHNEAVLVIDNGEHDVSLETTPSTDYEACDSQAIENASLFPIQNPCHLQDMTVSLRQWNATSMLLDEYNLTKSICHHPTQLDMHMLIHFPFLDTFTNTTGFVASFQCGTKEHRLSVTAESEVLKAIQPPLALEVEISDLDTCWEAVTRTALTLHEERNQQEADLIDLLSTTHKIVSHIRNVALTKPRHSPIDLTWSVSSEALCYEFFHPRALQRHLALFWSCWYPNWPTIHRPTFDATRAPPALVAAMALLGACLSPDDRVHATAQIWLNAVEEIVFSNELFHDHNLSRAWQLRDQTSARRAQVDILQAAYCVCLYQTWEGCQRSKRRILRQRFNDVVFFARDIGLHQASLRTIDTSSPSAFDWKEFVLRESLIRLCSYICNIDASYALFFGNPPRLTFSELVMELSSPESCFQAQSKEECFIEIKCWRSRSGLASQNMTIIAAIEALSSPEKMGAASTRQTFAHLSVLNMFTIAHAIYLQLHSVQTSGLQSHQAMIESSLTVALRQWKDTWSSSSRDKELADLSREGSCTSNAWRSIGFIRHAPEYWLLMYLSLRRSGNMPNSSFTSSAITRCEDLDMGYARALLADLKSANVGFM